MSVWSMRNASPPLEHLPQRPSYCRLLSGSAGTVKETVADAPLEHFLLRGIGACDSTISVETAEMSPCRHRSPWTYGCESCGRSSAGSSIREAARRFAVSPSTAIKLMRRVRTTGSAAPSRYGGHRRPRLEPHESELKRLVEATPDPTLAELQTELERRFGVVAALSTIHNALRRIGLRH